MSGEKITRGVGTPTRGLRKRRRRKMKKQKEGGERGRRETLLHYCYSVNK